jgi:TatA/E family protein of Tat protein translocase
MLQMGFIGAPSPMELAVILVIALIVLGPKRLPETARSIGKGWREMREALSGGYDDDEDEEDDGVLEPPTSAEPPTPAART